MGLCTVHYCPICGEECNSHLEGDYRDGSHFMFECNGAEGHRGIVVWPQDEHEDGCECYAEEEEEHDCGACAQCARNT